MNADGKINVEDIKRISDLREVFVRSDRARTTYTGTKERPLRPTVGFSLGERLARKHHVNFIAFECDRVQEPRLQTTMLYVQKRKISRLDKLTARIPPFIM